MQYLKEHLRESILDVAESAFSKQGYSRTALRTIAARCSITVGNLYRYYDNKEALLDAVLAPLIAEIDDILSQTLIMQSLDSKAAHSATLANVAQRLTLLCQHHFKRITILVNGVEGTSYAHFFDQLVKRVALSMAMISSHTMGHDIIDPIIFEVLARNNVEGILHIITHVKTPKKQQDIITKYLSIHMCYFENKLSEESHEKV